MKKDSKVYFRTCEDMSVVESKSIDLIVTSPPYWDLKDYESEDQIGFKENYLDYLNRIDSVWKECIRCLKDNGVFIININTNNPKSYV